MADVDDRQQFFINAGNQDDQDELLDELNELEAEMLEDDLNVEIGGGAIDAGVRKEHAGGIPAKQ